MLRRNQGVIWKFHEIPRYKMLVFPVGFPYFSTAPETQKSLPDALLQATTIFIGDLVLAVKGSEMVDLLGMTCTNEWIFLLPIT